MALDFVNISANKMAINSVPHDLEFSTSGAGAPLLFMQLERQIKIGFFFFY